MIEILNISVITRIKYVGKAAVAVIAIKTEYRFTSQDEVEVIEFIWLYSAPLQ